MYVGDPRVDLVDDLPHGLESPSSTSKAPIPSNVTRLTMFLIMPSSTASATLPPRGCGGPLDPKMVVGRCGVVSSSDMGGVKRVTRKPRGTRRQKGLALRGISVAL